MTRFSASRVMGRGQGRLLSEPQPGTKIRAIYDALLGDRDLNGLTTADLVDAGGGSSERVRGAIRYLRDHYDCDIRRIDGRHVLLSTPTDDRVARKFEVAA